jgi:hypothetical protein
MESLESRQLLAVDFQFNFVNAPGTADDVGFNDTNSAVRDGYRQAVIAAGQRIGGWLTHTATIQLDVFSTAGPTPSSFGAEATSEPRLNIPVTFAGFAKGVIQAKIQDGTDHNAATPDGKVFVTFPSDTSQFTLETNPLSVGTTSISQIDFQAVIIHELTHALGFASFISPSGVDKVFGTGVTEGGVYLPYDQFISDINGNRFINPNTGMINQAAWLTHSVGGPGPNSGLFFDGPNAKAANNGNRVPLFSANPFSAASQTGHLDSEGSTLAVNGTVSGGLFSPRDHLMTHNTIPGARPQEWSPLEKAMLQDIGYVMAVPRTLTPPQAITLEANAQFGFTGTNATLQAFLSGAVASNPQDNPVITHDAPSPFPLGPTTVQFTATYSDQSQVSASAIVTVQDTTAPSITIAAPTTVTLEATGPGGVSKTALPFQITATDIVDPNPSITSNASAMIALGTNQTIIYTARDASNNTATAQAMVSVVDTMPPTLNALGSIEIRANAGGSANINNATLLAYVNANASDLVDQSLTFFAEPSIIPQGTSTVTITARDDAGNSSQADVIVTVTDSADFIVDTNLDLVDPNDGKLSLREAIIAANAQAGLQEIAFDSSVEFIFLSMGQLEITDSLTITGPGSDALTIDAQGNSRIFVSSGAVAATNIDLILSGLRLINGDSSTQTISDTPITGGALDNRPPTRGGTIFFYSQGTLALNDVTISGSSSPDDGGAILHWGTGELVVNESRISGNTSGDNGGAIYSRGSIDHLYNKDGRVRINDSVISGNTAADKGGGITTRYSTLEVVRSTISGNKTTTSDDTTKGGGGLYTFAGDMVIVHSTISGNQSARDGGGIKAIDNRGSVTMIGSTISGNTAAQNGGGIYTFDTIVSLNQVTVTGNTAGGIGGGLDGLRGSSNVLLGFIVVRNSIVAANNAGSAADIAQPRPLNNNDRIIILDSLIGDNSNQSSGVVEPASSTKDPSTGNIVGTASAKIDPKLGPLAFNGGPTQTHALFAGSLAIEAGGDNSTAAKDVLDVDSDGNTDEVISVDQRGQPFGRFEDGIADATITNAMDMGAYERQTVRNLPSPLVVTTADDEFDENPLGDLNDLSLREAISLANGSIGSDTITFDESVTDEISLELGELQITDSVTIIGLRSKTSFINAGGKSRVFNIEGDSIDVTLAGLTVRGGRMEGDNELVNGQLDSTYSGGGIRFISEGTLLITDSEVIGNTTVGENASGGAIFAAGGNVTVQNSQIDRNTTRGVNSLGGAIANPVGNINLQSSSLSGNRTIGAFSPGAGIYSSLGTVTLNDSTLYFNSTYGNSAAGAGIYAPFGNVTVTNSTISGNRIIGVGSAGAGIATQTGNVKLINSTVTGNTISDNGTFAAGISIASQISQNPGTLTIHNSIVAGNQGGSQPDFVAPPNPASNLDVRNSLIGESAGTSLTASAMADSNGNIVGVDWKTVLKNDGTYPILQNNGGRTQTIALVPNTATTTNPAIDAGSNALAKDADGNALLFDQRGNPFARENGARVDMGAYELQTLPASAFVVTTSVDELDFSNNDGASPQVSLREAIYAANGSFGADTITFAESVTAQILLSLGQLEITDSVTIQGLSQETTVIDAQQQSQVLNVEGTSLEVTLENLTLTGGQTTGNSQGGGGIRFNSGGTLALTNSAVTGNSTSGPGARGGGIYSRSGSVTLTSSTVSGNSTSGREADGGGIFSRSGSVTLTSSTVSDNSTAGYDAYGGGIGTLGGAVTLTNSTVSGNRTADSWASGGGINTDFGAVTLIGSTVTGNRTVGRLARGGGINTKFGAVTLTSSIVDGNSTAGYAASGGGIHIGTGALTLTSSTVSGNRTQGNEAAGGGVWFDGSTARIVGSTITGNSASGRGGGFGMTGTNAGKRLTIHNSIIAGNTDGDSDSSAPDFVAPGNPTNDLDVKNSLVGDSAGTSLTTETNGNRLNVDWTTVLENDGTNPILKDNGGPTQTIALIIPVTGSNPAIDGGDNALAKDADGNDLMTDQRGAGFARVHDGDGDSTATVDMGAFEAADIDITPPLITAPQPTTIEATSAAGIDRSAQAVQDFLNSFTVTDDKDSNPTVSSDTPENLPLGTTAIKVTATDASGNQSTATVNLTVSDTTSPMVTAPSDLTIEADTATGASVLRQQIIDFLTAATATDTVDANVIITNDAPTSGEITIGTITVTFTGADDAGNQGTATAQITVTERSLATLDFGDAPASFPVATHIVGSLFLGAGVTAEFEGTLSTTASSDSNDDGITLLATAIAASTPTRSSLAVVASAAGKLDAWIDFNGNGSWQAGEQIFDSVDVAAGANTLSYQIPAGASVGGNAARFRLSSAGSLDVTGAASDGEVEDYIMTIEAAATINNVTVISISPGTVTIEPVDTDVIVREGSTILFQGPAASLALLDFTGTSGNDTINLTTNFVDFTSGMSIDAGTGIDTVIFDQVSSTLDLSAGSSVTLTGVEVLDIRGTHQNSLKLDAAAIGQLADDDRIPRVLANPMDIIEIVDGGFVISGALVETGQFVVQLRSTPTDGGAATRLEVVGKRWTNPIDPTDVTGTDGTTATDALRIINQLNSPDVFDPETGVLQDPATVEPSSVFSFFDVSGDGILTAVDALQVINRLNELDISSEPFETRQLAPQQNVVPPATSVILDQVNHLVVEIDWSSLEDDLELLVADQQQLSAHPRKVDIVDKRKSSSGDDDDWDSRFNRTLSESLVDLSRFDFNNQ